MIIMFEKVNTIHIKDATNLKIAIASEDEAKLRWDTFFGSKAEIRKIKSKKKGTVLTLDFSCAKNEDMIHLSYRNLTKVIFSNSTNVTLFNLNNDQKVDHIALNEKSTVFINKCHKDTLTVTNTGSSSLEIGHFVIKNLRANTLSHSKTLLKYGVVQNLASYTYMFSHLRCEGKDSFIVNATETYGDHIPDVRLNVINHFNYVNNGSSRYFLVYGFPTIEEIDQYTKPDGSKIINEKYYSPRKIKAINGGFDAYAIALKEVYKKELHSVSQFDWSIEVGTVELKQELPRFFEDAKSKAILITVDSIKDKHLKYIEAFNALKEMLKHDITKKHSVSFYHDKIKLLIGIMRDTYSFINNQISSFKGDESLIEEYKRFRYNSGEYNDAYLLGLRTLKMLENKIDKEQFIKEKNIQNDRNKEYVINILNKDDFIDEINKENKHKIIDVISSFDLKEYNLSKKAMDNLEKLEFLFDLNKQKNKICSF